MTTLVLDASVLAKTVLPEEQSDEVRSTIRAAEARADRLLAPALARYELGNILLRRSRASGETAAEIEESIRRAMELVTVVSQDPPVAPIASRHGLSYYDGAYLALAKAHGGRLWTYDRDLGRAADAENARFRP